MFDEGRFRQILREELKNVLTSQGEPPGEYMTPAQAAEWCQVTPATLRNWRRGGLKCETLGRVVRYNRKELEAFLGRRTAMTPESCIENLLRE